MTITWDGWNQLLAPPPPWAHLVVGAERVVEQVMRWQTPRDLGIVVRSVRGEHCATKAGLFDEWAAALQFPYYFGGNWDSFEECINDLEWLPARSYVFVMTHADCLLHDHADNEELATFASIIGTAAAHWTNRRAMGSQLWRVPASFHVVFHCDPLKETETRNRLAQVGVTLDSLSLLLEANRQENSKYE